MRLAGLRACVRLLLRRNNRRVSFAKFEPTYFTQFSAQRASRRALHCRASRYQNKQLALHENPFVTECNSPPPPATSRVSAGLCHSNFASCAGNGSIIIAARHESWPIRCPCLALTTSPHQDASRRLHIQVP